LLRAGYFRTPAQPAGFENFSRWGRWTEVAFCFAMSRPLPHSRRTPALCGRIDVISAGGTELRSWPRQKANFASGFNLICPVQPLVQKYSVCDFQKSCLYGSHPASAEEGRRDRHGRWKRACGGRVRSRWTSEIDADEQKRVVLASRCRGQVCGPSCLQATATIKARTPGSARHKP